MPRIIGHNQIPSTGVTSSTGYGSRNTTLYTDFNGTNTQTTLISEDDKAYTFSFHGNAQLSTTQKKFGATSLKLDGTGDYIQINDAVKEMKQEILADGGRDDFTFEAWVRWETQTDYQVIVHVGNNNSDDLVVGIDNNAGGRTGTARALYFMHETAVLISGASTLSASTWYHVALTRLGDTFKLFLNGTQQGSTYTATDATYSRIVIQNDVYSSNSPRIGARANATEEFQGYIDDLRFISGTAIYTANFTAPTAAAGKFFRGVQTKKFAGIVGMNDMYQKRIEKKWPYVSIGGRGLDLIANNAHPSISANTLPGGWRSTRFNASSTVTINGIGGTNTHIEMIVLAGGGGGHPSSGGGGGGSGGAIGPMWIPIAVGTYPIVIGAGGSTGSDGSATTFAAASNTAVGGGGGGFTTTPGRPGGAGGGAGAAQPVSPSGPFPGGSGTTGQGMPGGNAGFSGGPSTPIRISGASGGSTTTAGQNGNADGPTGVDGRAGRAGITTGMTGGSLKIGGGGASGHPGSHPTTPYGEPWVFPRPAGAMPANHGHGGHGGAPSPGAIGGSSGTVILRWHSANSISDLSIRTYRMES